MANDSRRKDELNAAVSTDENVIMVWAIDRTKPGLSLTLYPAGRTLVITADTRDKITRALSGEARRLNRGLNFFLARLYFEKFALQCKGAALKIIRNAYCRLFKFDIRAGHVLPLNVPSQRRATVVVVKSGTTVHARPPALGG